MLNNMLVITDDTAPILELHRREKSCLELRTYTKALWKASYHFFSKIFNAIVRSRSFLKLFIRVKMKYFFGAVLFAYFITTLANSTVKPTKEAHCNVNNNCNSFYAGPNCKKIEQQLEEIRQEIRALRENKTTGSVKEKVCNGNLICATNKQSGSSLSSMSL